MKIEKNKPKQHLSFRVSSELVDRLDAIVAREQKTQGNKAINRSDVILALLTQAIEGEES
jgi:predicted DNA-binding protein